MLEENVLGNFAPQVPIVTQFATRAEFADVAAEAIQLQDSRGRIIIQTMSLSAYLNEDKLVKAIEAAAKRSAEIMLILPESCPEAEIKEIRKYTNAIYQLSTTRAELLVAPGYTTENWWSECILAPGAVVSISPHGTEDKYRGFCTSDEWVLQQVFAHIRGLIKGVRASANSDRLPCRIPIDYFTTNRLISINYEEIIKRYPGKAVAVYLRDILGVGNTRAEAVENIDQAAVEQKYGRVKPVRFSEIPQ